MKNTAEQIYTLYEWSKNSLPTWKFRSNNAVDCKDHTSDAAGLQWVVVNDDSVICMASGREARRMWRKQPA